MECDQTAKSQVQQVLEDLTVDHKRLCRLGTGIERQYGYNCDKTVSTYLRFTHDLFLVVSAVWCEYLTTAQLRRVACSLDFLSELHEVYHSNWTWYRRNITIDGPSCLQLGLMTFLAFQRRYTWYCKAIGSQMSVCHVSMTRSLVIDVCLIASSV